jgi:hypothetical protein
MLGIVLLAVWLGVVTIIGIQATSAANDAASSAVTATQAVKQIAQSNKDLAQILNRRQPTLDFLKCRAAYDDEHDRLERQNALAERLWLLAAVTKADNEPQLRAAYAAANAAYLNQPPADCPTKA